MFTFDDYPEFSNSLRHKNLIWQDLQNMEVLGRTENCFHYFDSLYNASEFFSKTLDNNPVYLAVYPKGNFLVCLNLSELSDEAQCREQLTQLGPELVKLKLNAEVKNGVLAFSNSQIMIQKCFEKNNKKLVDNIEFTTFRNSVSYSGNCVYVGSGRTSSLLNASYSSLSFKPDKIILNGIQDAKKAGKINAKASSPINSNDFLNRIPLLCNAFKVFAVPDADEFFQVESQSDWWDAVNQRAMFNAKKQFYEQIRGAVVHALMPSGETALILECTDSLKLAELFPFMLDSLETGNSRIFALAKDSSSFSKSTFSDLDCNEFGFMAVFKNYFVLAASSADAEIFVNAFSNGSSVMDNKNFSQYISKNFDSEFSYADYRHVNALSKKNLPFSEVLGDSDLALMKNISHFSYVSKASNNKISFRLNLSYSQENAIDEPGVLWSLNNQSKIIWGPFLFKNHINLGNEIVFQDENDELCLQSATGKVLWKKKINEVIKSPIYTVDAFKNGRFQMLFNTDNYLHLVDRNGNEVQGYPVRLPAKASSVISVLDYEGKNELRIFIACADRKIWNYSIWGVRQEGFKPLQTSDEVRLPVRHCRVGLSDYLVTADHKGKLYAFSRKGEGRIDFKNKMIEDAENFEIEPGNQLGNTHIVYYDKKGHLINKVSLADKKEVYKADVSENAMGFGDFDNNKITDVILASESRVEAFNFNGTRIYSTDQPQEIKPTVLNYYRIGQRSFVVMFDQEQNLANIFEVEERRITNFKSGVNPVVCDLFNDGKVYVLLVEKGGISCLKL